MWLIPSREQWAKWSLPSKLTAIGALMGVLSLGLYIAEKSFGFLDAPSPHPHAEAGPMPPVALTLGNSTDESITIQRRGDFVLWLPQGVDHLRRLSGKFDLDSVEEPSTSMLVVSPGATEHVVAQLHAEYSLGDLLDHGAADLEFIFRRDHGGLLFSGSIPFARQKLVATRWEIDLSRKQ